MESVGCWISQWNSISLIPAYIVGFDEVGCEPVRLMRLLGCWLWPTMTRRNCDCASFGTTVANILTAPRRPGSRRQGSRHHDGADLRTDERRDSRMPRK